MFHHLRGLGYLLMQLSSPLGYTAANLLTLTSAGFINCLDTLELCMGVESGGTGDASPCREMSGGRPPRN